MSDDDVHPDGTDPVGDLGEEAAKLLGVLAGWTAAVDEHVATGAPECQWCPVCRVVHVVRTSPELRGHLTTAASALLKAAAALMATPEGPATAPGGSARADDDADPDADPGADGWEHIDLGGSDDTAHDTDTEGER